MSATRCSAIASTGLASRPQALAALGRQALHAARLSFAHPVSGEILHFEAALPPDMGALIDALRAEPAD